MFYLEDFQPIGRVDNEAFLRNVRRVLGLDQNRRHPVEDHLTTNAQVGFMEAASRLRPFLEEASPLSVSKTAPLR